MPSFCPSVANAAWNRRRSWRKPSESGPSNARLPASRCNDETAKHHKSAATAKSEAADSRYDRLGNGFDFVPGRKKVPHIEIGERLLRHLRYVRAGREGTRAACDHDRSDLVVCV